ncbi:MULTISPECIES: hypothetical protein [Vibrio]|uniref:Uncharacterized protein n=1 Tax=Vibrio mimicus TaxID=674 RepID=A0A2J9VKH2_VIBMI|nr:MULTISPECIES: hypothetical protein [Vibrio]EGR0523745.1 hypothetical protein [Vibrio cholerae]EGR0598455.1 hypothetical protein [Vibrio cholerae]EGR1044238.1 hypothetical protein [Vibrio cholerae]EGR2081480.1 hypothetical protein [Vibrio cholerae]EGR3968099.1 hypothetical protein [Vibrio cholerae]
MLSALSAKVVIDVSLDMHEGQVNYTITTHEGDSSGINQLAEKLTQRILHALPECVKPKGVTE